ncbi:hypothetical protein COD42_27680, partial [Escherichia coli]
MAESTVTADSKLTSSDTRRRIWAIVGASSGNLVEWFDFYVYSFCCNFAFFSGLIDAQFWAGIAQLKSPELTAKIYLFSSGLSPRPF